MYWEIEPSDDPDFDCAELPGFGEQNHIEAFEFAVERLGELFDAMEEGEEITVKIRCMKGEIPND